MVAIKEGVSISGLKPEILLAVVAAISVYQVYNLTVTITACKDGKHMDGSKHYIGQAVDLRLPSWYGLSAEADKVVHKLLKANLGNEYDVVLEGNHIHVEYDPPKTTVA